MPTRMHEGRTEQATMGGPGGKLLKCRLANDQTGRLASSPQCSR